MFCINNGNEYKKLLQLYIYVWQPLMYGNKQQLTYCMSMYALLLLFPDPEAYFLRAWEGR